MFPGLKGTESFEIFDLMKLVREKEITSVHSRLLNWTKILSKEDLLIRNKDFLIREQIPYQQMIPVQKILLIRN